MHPLVSRVLFAVALLPPVLGLVYLGGWWLAILAVMAASIALHEVFRLFRPLRPVALAGFAGALAAQGIRKGDRVIVYMPMVPEAAIAMLACARIGAVHSFVFGGFASEQLASRIEDAKPKVVVTASCGIEPGRIVAYKPMLDAAIDMVEAMPER